MVRTILGGTGVVLATSFLARNPIRRKIVEFVEKGDVIYLGDTSEPAIWFEVTSDNRVVLHSPKVEMGQGTFTGMAQIAADELEIDIEQIDVVHAATASGNIDGFATGGSQSIAGLWQPLRELSATMREMLRIEGARKLNVDIGSAMALNGKIVAGNNSLTYGGVVDGITEWKIPNTPELKEMKDYKFIGKPIPRVDLMDKVVGTPMFGMDASMPDMLYGAVLRPEKIGTTLKSYDATSAEGMPGVVKVVEEEDFVGVVAESLTQAENAKNAIVANWETDRVWQSADIEKMIEQRGGSELTIQKQGKAIKDKSTSIVSEYKSPIGAHAQIEPNGAVAFVEKDKATIMISTQVIKITRAEVASRLGMDDDQVNIIPTYLGGGFGRRLHTPNAIQAAVLSKAVQRPVKCFFSRQEEFQNDTFRPPTHHIMSATLDSNNMIKSIEHDFSSGHVMIGSPMLPAIATTLLGTDGGAIRGGTIHYKKIPNIRAVSNVVELPFATSWWRSLGLLANTFAIESFMDELAEKAGKDPIQFRLDHIQDNETGNRLRKVIEVARDKSGYKNEAQGKQAMGFATSTDAGTPCAQVAEVQVLDNTIMVKKVTCVIDPGFAVNPDQVKAQCEGSIIMGISTSMFERMYVEDGELKPIIYGLYKMATMRDAPHEIDVEIINGTGKPGAVGEPPLGPIGAAIANAVYRITGSRLREMPLKLG